MLLRRRSLLVGTSALVLAGATSPEAGTLNIAIPSNINTLDPAKTKLGEEYIICFLVFSGVTELDPSGRAVPDLVPTIAESRVVIRGGNENDPPGDRDHPDG